MHNGIQRCDETESNGYSNIFQLDQYTEFVYTKIKFNPLILNVGGWRKYRGAKR
jgi:hypothetical protein